VIKWLNDYNETIMTQGPIVIFCWKEVGKKATHKMLVKFTTVQRYGRLDGYQVVNQLFDFLPSLLPFKIS